MSEEMFQASLQEGEYGSTKSYDLGKLFYVAFFGGVMATLILSIKNAKWLKVNEKTIKLLVSAGIAALVIKIIILGIFSDWTGLMALSSSEGRLARWSMRGVAVAFFLVSYYLQKDRFHQHTVTVGDIQPLLKNAILWILLGGILEGLVVAGGVYAVGFFV